MVGNPTPHPSSITRVLPRARFREVTRQCDGAGPEFGPVREPFVAVEVFLVDQVVQRRRDG